VIRRLVVPLLVLVVGACATYREDLNRGQRLYEESEYERALAIWRFLEADLDSLEYQDQARYAYLRGMTDYRLGGGKGGTDPLFRAHARHWLALAKAIETEHPGGISEQWKGLMEEALGDLNAEVWGTSSSIEGSDSTAVETSQVPEDDADADSGVEPDSTTDDPSKADDTSAVE
jgi:hypothetical protein